ncbi:MAG: ABC transporter permease subunit [Acholeplasma sp.]|jgi:multiple sugar transport system permease protein|nr:MAG: ABC transporter permease subunit [Acholeplasma sp.]
MKKWKITYKQREALLGYLFIGLWIIGFGVFALYPIIYSFFLSLNHVTIPTTGINLEFIGFENYRHAFAIDRIMVLELGNFVQDSILMMVIINVFAMIFAMILNMNIKFKGFFRTIFFLPVVIVSGPVMQELLNNEAIILPGITNYQVIQIFTAIFGQGFGELIVDVFSNLIYMFWFSGVQIIVYLVMLQKMNKEVYEASEIDGASPWEQFWKVTLPFLKPIILINMIYTLVMLAGFSNNPIIILIKDYMFRTGEVGNGFGFSAALVWIYFVAIALIVIILFALFSARGKLHFVRNSDHYVFDMLRYKEKPSLFAKYPKVMHYRRKLIGRKGTDGWIFKAFTYVLIASVGFTFLYPFIFLSLKSLQSPFDLIDSSVGLIPTTLYLDNYVKAFATLGFFNSLQESVTISFLPALAQVVSTALIGYGLARFEFPLKKTIIVLILITFIIPAPVLMIPTYLMYRDLGILGNLGSFVYPALFGQGIKSTIFIMIFYQFFNTIPKVLDEAARVDGAGPIRVFLKVSLPLAIPAVVVVFLFSFVWYWNETYLTGLYMPEARTLPLQLSRFADSFRQRFGNPDPNSDGFVDRLNEAIYMAGTLISIVPLLLLYFGLQKWFVESVDRSGITGE